MVVLSIWLTLSLCLPHPLHSPTLPHAMALSSSLSLLSAAPVPPPGPSRPPLVHAPRRRRRRSPRETAAASNAERAEANGWGTFRAWDRCVSRSELVTMTIQAFSSDANVDSESYDGRQNISETSANDPIGQTSTGSSKPSARLPYLLSIAGILIGCALVYALIVSIKEGPSALVVAKSGFTAAFSLIFVSEIGDKTFFIAALLAMQYEKALVLLGSMCALALMTILSVIIGRIFKSVPSQFRTTLPVGEYAAVALLVYFGLTSIKNAWELPPDEGKNSKKDSEIGELAEAEELVKEKVASKLTNPFQIISKSFSLVFFAEWGDRSMLATIALGAAQSPWGVAGGAIAGHLFATSIAVLGGSLLARYISEKMVGYFGGALFLIFAVATLFGVF